jgi:5-methylcytosine-specific restriction endonuclease McrA
VGYTNFQVQITKKRINNSDYKRLLFIKQHGICCHCSTPLVLNEYNLVDNYIIHDPLDLHSQTEIHHVTSIAAGMSAGPKKHSQSNKLENLQLLHKDCHSEITFNPL